MIQYSECKYECHFFNDTGPIPVSFFIHGDFMLKAEYNFLKIFLSSLKDFAKDWDSFLQK